MDKFPLIKFVIFFICGILLQFYFRIENLVLLYLFLSIVSASAISIFYLKTDPTKNILLVSSIIIGGAIFYSSTGTENAAYPFKEPKIKNAIVSGRIYSIDLAKKDRVNFYIDTDSIYYEKRKLKACLKILVKVSDAKSKLVSLYQKISIGNSIQIAATILKPRDQRNPGEFDYEKYLSAQGVSALCNVYKTSDVNITNSQKSIIANAIFGLRKSIDKIISKIHNQSTASLLRGLILADKSMIENQLRNEFVNAGVIHVLAVSGLHVGFVILIFVFLFRRFNIYLRYLLTILGLFLFMIMTGAPASVTRATIMAIALLLAPLTGREYNSINSLALAAFILLLINPNQIFEPGFQLSFSAVFAIITIYPVLNKKINDIKLTHGFIKYLLQFFAVSFAAQVGTLPFTLAYFHKLSVVAFAANFFVIPIIGVIIGLGLLTIMIAPISIYLASVYASTNELLGYILFKLVNFMGGAEYSYISINNFSLYDSILFYAALVFLFVNIKKFISIPHKLFFVSLSIAVSIIFLKIDDTELLKPNKLSIMAIDIGQGDSFLIKFPNGETALIDAGEANKYFDNGGGVIIPLLERQGIKKIDYAFVSHIDSDHYSGFVSLVKNKIIRQIYKPKLDTSLQKDVEFETLLRTNKIPIIYYSKKILKISGARLFIMNDTTNVFYSGLSINDKSGFMKLIYGKTSCLFTGDAGLQSEKYYENNYGSFLKSDILKAGHHGSKTSSGRNFIETVKPEFVLISAGVANKFRHPNKETIEKFEKIGSKIFRTDLSGAVLFETDGQTLKNINWKKQQSGFIF